ncbi:CPBP family intramembrane metalloprotease [Candidatus Fermentibacteria bacterium]|nr:CPBP family intramembrane metalloprotease [Candidatus Fermentibacteria bacterium]
MAHRLSFRLVTGLALAAAIALAALQAPRVIRLPAESFFPSSWITHSVMLTLSLAAMWLLSRGRLALFGFTLGTFRFSPRILLWAVPTAVLSLLAMVASGGAQGRAGPAANFTKLQIVVFVWVYASICEEVLTRGLLQTLLGGNSDPRVSGSRRLSLPVVVSGVFFGLMHIVLIRSMGAAAGPLIVLTILLGLVAARYRERTGSLLPAVIIHALFNIGGMLPVWVVHWLRG